MKTMLLDGAALALGMAGALVVPAAAKEPSPAEVRACLKDEATCLRALLGRAERKGLTLSLALADGTYKAFRGTPGPCRSVGQHCRAFQPSGDVPATETYFVSFRDFESASTEVVSAIGVTSCG